VRAADEGSRLTRGAIYCPDSAVLHLRQERQPAEIRAIAWRAQLRLNHPYRRLKALGLHHNKICVALARELAAFVWDIGRPARCIEPVNLTPTRWRAAIPAALTSRARRRDRTPAGSIEPRALCYVEFRDGHAKQ
jgi:hypothetical protein